MTFVPADDGDDDVQFDGKSSWFVADNLRVVAAECNCRSCNNFAAAVAVALSAAVGGGGTVAAVADDC